MARPRKEQNKGGRRGLYLDWITPEGLTAIEGWAREGATDSDIARKIGVVLSTLYDWKSRFPEISDALKRGKAPVDFEVENQLLKSALGFTVTVKEPVKLKKKTIKNGVGTIEEEHIEYAEREIYVKPDTTAQIFWLKNRKPDKWRDKPAPDAAKEAADDGFLDALNGKAADLWADGDDEVGGDDEQEESDVSV